MGIDSVPIKWVHFGDGREKKKLTRLSETKLGDNINWEFKGRVSNSDVLNWYQENKPSIFINVSSSEGIPVSIMEAMSFGVPCISTDVGASSEIVNKQNGKLISSNPKKDELIEAINYFRNLPDVDYQSYSSAAYETWEKKYNAERNYKRFTEVISNL